MRIRSNEKRFRASRVALAVLLVALAAAAAPARPAAGGDSAAAFVEGLYRFHFAHKQNWDATRKHYAARFSPRLTKLLVGDERLKAASNGDLIGLDFDPPTFSQSELAGYRVGATSSDGTATIVTVDLWLEGSRPGKHEHDVRVRLSRGQSGWTIEDFESEDYRLTQSLEADQ